MMIITTKDKEINIEADKNPLFRINKEGVKTVLRLEISGRYIDLVKISDSITSENFKSVSFNGDELVNITNEYINVYKAISSIGEVSKHSPNELRDDRVKLNIEVDIVAPGDRYYE